MSAANASQPISTIEPRTPVRLGLVLNVGAGGVSESLADELGQRFAAVGVVVESRAVTGVNLGAATRDLLAAGVQAIVAAGGDGTVNSVAGVVADSGVPLGVLPVGTLNHFAKDLGLPLDLEAAVATIASALREDRVTCVDVGTVNGRMFLNNSSIGFYPRVVRHREKLRAKLFRSKWVAMFYAIFTSFRRYPEFDVTLELGKPGGPPEAVSRRTPFVFVGNNRYALHLFAMGGRTRLDRGELCVYVAHRPGRFGTVVLLIMALFRRLKQARDFNAYLLPQVTVDTPKRRVAVSIDGEIHYMQPPLRYATREKCLKVLV